MGEPRITMTTKDDFKLLLGGTDMAIDVKCGARQWLQRILTIVTTNEDIGARLASANREAVRSRAVQYNFTYQISSFLAIGSIKELPSHLCTCHLIQLFKNLVPDEKVLARKTRGVKA